MEKFMNDSEIALSEAEKEENLEKITAVANKLDLEFSVKRGPASGGAFYRIDALEPEGNEFGMIQVRSINEYPADPGEPVDFDYGEESALFTFKKEPDGKLSFVVSGDVEGRDEIERSLAKALSDSGL